MFFGKKKQAIKEIDASHIEKKLKPLWGLSPNTYMKMIFYALIAIILFFLVFNPFRWGKLGTYMVFNSTPAEAAVYLDDQRLGATPLKVFVKKGSYRLTIKKPYYKAVTEEITTRGQLLFSGILPLKTKIDRSLELEDLKGLLDFEFKQASLWVLTAQSKSFPRGTSLLDGAKDLEKLWPKLAAEERQMAEEWLDSLPFLVESQTSLDEVWAVYKLMNAYYQPKITLTNSNDFFESLITSEVPVDGVVKTNIAAIKAVETVAGLTFYYDAGGSFIMGNKELFQRQKAYEYYPHEEKIAPFYFMSQVVTEQELSALYKLFGLEDNAPYARLDEGSVGAKFVSYLEAVSLASYLTAELNKKTGWQNYEIKLINEAQWEYLVRQNKIVINGYEWMTDSYFSYDYLYKANKMINFYEGSEKVVRGFDETLNAQMAISERGSQQEALASPYVGLRFVMMAR